MEFVDVSLKFNCEDDCVTIPDIQNGVYTEKIKQILEELVGKYSIDNVTEMKTEVNLKIDELTQLYDKIHLFREFFETKLKLALFLDLTHGDDCSKIESYLSSILLNIDLIKMELSQYLEAITIEYIPFESNVNLETIDSSLDIFVKIRSAKDVLYEISPMSSFKAVGEKIIAGLRSDQSTGSRLLQFGFFEMDVNWVIALLDSGYMSWGGFYPKKKDWMHFEIRQDDFKYGAAIPKAAEELYKKYPLPLLKKELEKLGVEVKWNDMNKKDYLIIVKD